METHASNSFKVSKSKTVRYTTIIIWLLVVAVLIPVWYMVTSDPVIGSIIIMAAVTFLVAVVMAYFYSISPRLVEIGDGALVIHRAVGRKEFRYDDIKEAGLWTGNPLRLFRLCGCDGFYGYTGWFSGGGLGKHFEYVGKYADAFYIKLRSGRTYMLSCDEAKKVVERINGKKVKR